VVNNIIIVILILSLLLSFLTIISLNNYVFAQYSGGEQSDAATLEELKEKNTELKEKLQSARETLEKSRQFDLGSFTDNGSKSFDKQYQLDKWRIPIPISSNNFLDYINSLAGYTIKYPDNWNKLVSNAITEDNYNTTFYPPLEEQKPSVYLIITNTFLSNIPISLEAIVDETIKNLNFTLTNFKLVESESILLNTNDKNYAHKLVYSYNEFNKTLTNMDTGLIANNNFFLLSFVSSSDKYNEYLPTIEKMIETFTTDIDYEWVSNMTLTPVSVNATALGDEQAKITIVEFADYQCYFCAKFNNETKDLIIKNFVNTGKVKFLFKDLIVNDRPNDKASTLAASASYCAAEQGKYWEYNDELYKNSQSENTGWVTKDNLKQWVTKDNLKQFANNIMIPNIIKFSECLESEKYNNLVVENDSLAKSIGVFDTPTFYFYKGTIHVKTIYGVHGYGVQPYEFEQIINELLN
jgi:protein-disulfide isomerase